MSLSPDLPKAKIFGANPARLDLLTGLLLISAIPARPTRLMPRKPLEDGWRCHCRIKPGEGNDAHPDSWLVHEIGMTGLWQGASAVSSNAVYGSRYVWNDFWDVNLVSTAALSRVRLVKSPAVISEPGAPVTMCR